MNAKLLDVNVVVATSVPSHAHHSVAKNWFKSASEFEEPVWVAEESLASFARLASIPSVTLGLTPIEATEAFDRLRRDGYVEYIRGGDKRFEIFKSLLRRTPEIRGKLVPDAFLAALALEHGATLVTFDRDFLRFPDVQVELLTP